MERQINVAESMARVGLIAGKLNEVVSKWFRIALVGTLLAAALLVISPPLDSWFSFAGIVAVFSLITTVASSVSVFVIWNFSDFLEQLSNLPKTMNTLDALKNKRGDFGDASMLFKLKTLVLDVALELDEIVDPAKLTPGYWSVVILAFVGSICWIPAVFSALYVVL